MPIPDLPVSGEISRQEIIDMYAEEPYAWKRVLQFDWVEISQRTGILHKVHYRFDADALPCGDRKCVQWQLTFLQLRPAGVIKTCAICRRTEGPITKELGIIVETTPITVREAWDIVNATGQVPPKGLDPIQVGSGLQITR